MELILLILIVYFVYRHFNKKGNVSKKGDTMATPQAGSKEEKRAIKEFKKELDAAKGYGAKAVEAKTKIRDFYEMGYGTEKNLELAARWNMDAAMEIMRSKITFDDIWGVRGCPGYLYSNFEWFTKHDFLNKANELATLALKYGYRSASDMFEELDRIKQEKVSGQSVEKGTRHEFESLYGDYLAAQAGIHARSENVYSELMREIGQDKTLAQKIDLLLKKAGWTVKDADTGSEVVSINDKKFQEAYMLEKQGNDFKKVANIYETLANEGNSEAQRRLAHLNCRVFSAYINDEKEQKGNQLLELSAQAGNAIAAFELGHKEFDLSQIVTWAKAGYRDAVVVLGTMLERGNDNYKPNWEISQAVFHILYEEIGNAVAKKDGEGLWIQLELGKKMGKNHMMFIDEMVRKGNEISYAPAQFDYAHRTRVVANDAAVKYKGVSGGPGRYSEYYNRLVWESAQKPIEAGYAKAVALSRYHREQEDAIDTFVHKVLSDAEEGKGSWSVSNWSPKQRVAFEAAKIQTSIDAACTVRMAYGQISLEYAMDAQREKKSYNPDEWMERISEQQKTVDKTEDAYTFVETCPSIITDDMGRDWYFAGIALGGARFRLPEGNFVNPEFDLGDSLGREVIISDAEIQKGSAKTIGRTFHW